MNVKKIFGYVILAIPFFVLFLFMSLAMGIIPAVLIAFVVAFIVGCVMYGTYLIEESEHEPNTATKS